MWIKQGDKNGFREKGLIVATALVAAVGFSGCTQQVATGGGATVTKATSSSSSVGVSASSGTLRQLALVN